MPLNFKCIIIDDEPSAIELLSEYIKEIPALNIFKVYTNPISAIVEIKEEDEIDVALIDINMPEISGIELAFQILNKVKYIIFITGHPQYAIEAFGVHAFDYLLKPIRLSQFINCMNGVIKIINDRHYFRQTKHFFIKGNVKGRFLAIKSDDIILIYTKAHYLIIETESGQFKTNETMKNIEDRLIMDCRFLRVHQSNIINLEKVVGVDGNTVHLVNQWTVPVSDFYKMSLQNIISRQLLNLR